MGLKNRKNKSEEAIETEPVSTDNFFATPGLMNQQLGKNGAEYTESPLAPTFCTPGLKIPSTNNTALVNFHKNESSNFVFNDSNILLFPDLNCLFKQHRLMRPLVVYLS